MALILSLETSTDICSVALHKEGVLLSEQTIQEEGAHSKMLPQLIEDVMKEGGYQLKDLSAVAVSGGPGSYTGLRIGASTAKGLAFALEIPLISVDTLQAMAVQAWRQNPNAIVVSMLDARRMEVFREVFGPSGEVLEPIAAEILDENSFSSWISRTELFFVGNANQKAKEVITSSRAIFLDVFPNASSVGEIAWGKYQKEDFEDVAYFTPNYLKEFRLLKSKKNPFAL
ncbi:tRNA (adenosine(37)-N6)-threonylcarbamoyltransferase complex dimerization subunit type 1 TsaB [Algoriphagus kandeliae]|uniref:tRNA (Adenosine(37)-N6)-threonylcarbamoyltransferase complex dimerization subunit type 1 TsaB n=1 Tax=Algoriphagus kandeliae TaxID=2562278 RepID=A0A4Y9QHN5_9BACT|nr:tRNA (adenosine(37)-N6)-threonylcarbamoyltransferase complex dimerization subunit type 1 TsaB [Algoriphagus kandeliae]TFV92204.1 tRNA (adenosine(37)-N6)-threonylcarbamoyltransferase complex dimerization subunit type 1 TsaB [Algoriphagus kandeliae]